MVAQPPSWIDGVALNSDRLRRIDSVLTMSGGNGTIGARTGVIPGTNGLNTSLSGTTITVSAGIAIVYAPNRGVYRCPMTSVSTLTLQAADATLTRIDLVYLRVWDNGADGSGLNQCDVVYLPGTASSTPVAPTPDASQIYMPLATITVPPVGGGSASVSTAVRPWTVAPGGILPLQSSAPPSPYVGQYYDDQSDLRRWNGSSWDTYQKVITTAWTTASLATGYTHDGNSNGQVQYRKVTIQGTNFMEWRGGLGITYSGNALQNGGNFLSAALGTTLRPPSTRSMAGPCSATNSSSLSLKVDFKTDGTTAIVGTTTATTDTYSTPIIRPPWVSLNGIRYALS